MEILRSRGRKSTSRSIQRPWVTNTCPNNPSQATSTLHTTPTLNPHRWVSRNAQYTAYNEQTYKYTQTHTHSVVRRNQDILHDMHTHNEIGRRRWEFPLRRATLKLIRCAAVSNHNVHIAGAAAAAAAHSPHCESFRRDQRKIINTNPEFVIYVLRQI